MVGSFFFLFTDVTEPLLIEVDKIYHLACPASPIFYKHNPVKVSVFRLYLLLTDILQYQCFSIYKLYIISLSDLDRVVSMLGSLFFAALPLANQTCLCLFIRYCL